ncbi:hypothetical protein IW261DRAFT_1423003 [Armillaria novae-zelandiae]|uniref:Uncharacterized protein n=1 Tax=Armillaria novae-zelandiae TaxID=153914 RepID=A0AA39NYV8_9AGAR|nr:hypothetical protein IW261DRAFT_1423003 [Armillaria novae-zelandiae]
MPLSRIVPMDMDQVRELLTETTSVNTKQLLQTYKDEGAIDGYFQVDTTQSDEYNYLLWSNSDKEVVLQVQGVLLEGHVPPVVGSGKDNIVAFLKWDKKVDGSMHVTAMKPTMLHAGHIVDIGICFHMLKLNNHHVWDVNEFIPESSGEAVILYKKDFSRQEW